MTNKEFLRWIEKNNPTLLEVANVFNNRELNIHQEIIINSEGIKLKEDSVSIPFECL